MKSRDPSPGIRAYNSKRTDFGIHMENSQAEKDPAKLKNVGIRSDLHAALKIYSRFVGRRLGQVIELAVIEYSIDHPALRAAIRETERELTIK